MVAASERREQPPFIILSGTINQALCISLVACTVTAIRSAASDSLAIACSYADGGNRALATKVMQRAWLMVAPR